MVPDPAGSTLNVLRVLYPLGSFIRNGQESGGAGWKAKHFGKWDTALLEYDIMFSKNFDFVLGGKLPGFYGGQGDCNGGRATKTCFSTRFMWRKDGDSEVRSSLILFFCEVKPICLQSADISISGLARPYRAHCINSCAY